MAKSAPVDVRVGNRTLRLTNLDKVFWPETGFSKADMIDYYTRVAPAILPHLKDRPLTLKRYPDGVEGQMFYEKNCPKHRPPWVETATVWSGGNQRDMDYCLVQDLASLVWVAQLGTVELHTSLSLRDPLDRPRSMVFDLDPGPSATIVECCQVALWLREWFDSKNLQTLCKTSGSKGLQLYMPINSPVDYAATKTISKGLAEAMEREHHDLVVSRQTKTLREGRVLIDWSQNDEHKTTVNVYSLRARSRPTVSTPVSWEEVEKCHRSGEPQDLVFEASQVLQRIERHGDLFEPVAELRQKLPKEV
ncbi:MAG TPA: non-homologous end-joining DNA ligase [Candidatus Dormibacteraeota bacterium]|jgi:bifunctional non-homologous end joining protein LigD|nr:non-homologous end-joining DNA ligase [Candidatus Dormibacteraeota bacterium]